MSCAAEKAAFLRSLFYRPVSSQYSGGGGSSYGAPSALQRAYSEAARPKMMIYAPNKGTSYSMSVVRGYHPQQSMQHGFSISRGYSPKGDIPFIEQQVPVINLDERKPVFISANNNDNTDNTTSDLVNPENEVSSHHYQKFSQHRSHNKKELSEQEFKDIFSGFNSKRPTFGSEFNDLRTEQETLEQLLAREKEAIQWNNN